MFRCSRLFVLAVPIFILAGCAAEPPIISAAPPPTVVTPVPPRLVQIIGRNEAAVTALLGAPSMARTEGTARQLQFIRPPCVFDVFLYPEGDKLKVRTATARKPDGSVIEPGACLLMIIPAVR